MPETHDRVEDRTTFAGSGEVMFITGNEVRVRFDDGAEEAISVDLFEERAPGLWFI